LLLDTGQERLLPGEGGEAKKLAMGTAAKAGDGCGRLSPTNHGLPCRVDELGTASSRPQGKGEVKARYAFLRDIIGEVTE